MASLQTIILLPNTDGARETGTSHRQLLLELKTSHWQGSLPGCLWPCTDHSSSVGLRVLALKIRLSVCWKTPWAEGGENCSEAQKPYLSQKTSRSWETSIFWGRQSLSVTSYTKRQLIPVRGSKKRTAVFNSFPTHSSRFIFPSLASRPSNQPLLQTFLDKKWKQWRSLLRLLATHTESLQAVGQSQPCPDRPSLIPTFGAVAPSPTKHQQARVM